MATHPAPDIPRHARASFAFHAQASYLWALDACTDLHNLMSVDVASLRAQAWKLSLCGHDEAARMNDAVICAASFAN